MLQRATASTSLSPKAVSTIRAKNTKRFLLWTTFRTTSEHALRRRSLNWLVGLRFQIDWCSFEYCQSARSSALISTPFRSAISLHDLVYFCQNSNVYCLGTGVCTDQRARKSSIGYRSLWNKCKITEAVGQRTPSSATNTAIRARSSFEFNASRVISATNRSEFVSTL